MQAKKAKKNIEAIYPLSFLQQALLFHSLQESDDEGFLQVECIIRGKINTDTFEEAWNKVIARHEALRTSIHWENIEKPVQVVHRKEKVPFFFEDWSEENLSDSLQKEKLTAFKGNDREQHLNLSSAPVLRVSLIKLTEEKYFLLWCCHHILADGWSASTVLNDLLKLYRDSPENGETPELSPVPSYKDYLDFVKKQDDEKAEMFWKKALDGFENPALIGNKDNSKQISRGKFSYRTVSLSQEETDAFKVFARKNRITLGTLTHGLWAILLSRYLNTDDIVFGTTVSGRAIDLPHAELLTGMFMNVLPVRIKTEREEKLSVWLRSFQEFLSQVRNYEYLSLDKILSWKNPPGKDSLFDSLVVFENISLELNSGKLKIENFKSGLTSTYPLTLAVTPGEQISFFIKYNESLFSKKEINWWAENLSSLLKTLSDKTSQTIGVLMDNFSAPVPLETKTGKESVLAKYISGEKYVAPNNNIELELVKIWETLLDREPISTTDNFFELGGRSIIAVRMFAQIAEKLKRNLPPTTLLKHSTIKDLASFMQSDQSEDNWSSLVPIRASGTKPPIFCIHAGGGHVLYYKALADYLDKEQPVYGIQPRGLDGSEPFQESVEEMASHYLAEIKKIQPEGPYLIVGYCFGTAVCIEMAIQLEQMGESNFKSIIIDSHPMHMRFDKDLIALSPTLGEKLQSYYLLLKQKNWKEFFQRSFYKLTNVSLKFKRIINIRINKAGKLENNLQRIHNSLGRVFEKYKWKLFDFKITLILSGNLKTHPWNRVVIASWKTLALKGVEYHFINGSHMSLFEEPDVRELGKKLQQILDEDLKNNAETSSE